MHDKTQKLTLIVPLPVIMTRDSTFALVSEVFKRLRQNPNHVLLDFTKLEEIQVGGVTVLCNLIGYFRHRGMTVEFLGADFCDAHEFVESSGLMALGSDKAVFPKATKSFLPIRLVEYSHSHSYMYFDLVPWLAENMGCHARALATLRVCFEEIFNNIRDHSTLNVGCGAAHYNATSGEIIICVSDFGVGIPERVRAATEIQTDVGAIAKACEEGFTTKTTERNMGAGLYVLIKNVVEWNRGTVVIHSGSGIYTCTPGTKPGTSKRVGRTANFKYPGTMIRITLQKSDFRPDEVNEEEFQWD
jgi:anti-sigma regulatory factor (Ser/Thr protein kinase)/ABC-type transporter Mla MlaB component